MGGQAKGCVVPNNAPDGLEYCRHSAMTLGILGSAAPLSLEKEEVQFCTVCEPDQSVQDVFVE